MGGGCNTPHTHTATPAPNPQVNQGESCPDLFHVSMIFQFDPFHPKISQALPAPQLRSFHRAWRNPLARKGAFPLSRYFVLSMQLGKWPADPQLLARLPEAKPELRWALRLARRATTR